MFFGVPGRGVWVIGALGRLGIGIGNVPYKRSAVRADVAELTIAAYGHLVFRDGGDLYESGISDCRPQASVSYVAAGVGHGRATLDLSIRCDADFPVETSVIVLRLSEMLQV